MEFKNKQIMDSTIKDIGGSLHVLIPKQLREWIQIKPGTPIKIMTDESKHGKFIAIWKKE